MDGQQLAELRQHACSTSYAASSSSAHCGDAHLMLSIPWCGRQLKWQVLLSGVGSKQADFIFDDETFQPLCTSDPARTAEVRRLKAALVQFQSGKAAAALHASAMQEHGVTLADLLGLLLDAFREHQRIKLTAAGASNTRLQFEMSTLPEARQLQLLYMEARDGDPSKACISIPLEGLDLSRLSVGPGSEGTASGPESSEGDPTKPLSGKAAGLGTQDGESSFRLSATFKLVASNPEPEIHLQAPVFASSWVSGFQLPPWTHHMCLMEYVPLVVGKLQLMLDGMVQMLWAKQQLFEHLHAAFGAPLEYNAAGHIAMYHIAYEATPVLLHIDASSARFPEEKPVLTFTHVRALGAGPDGQRTYKDFPWSPRWVPQEMASRIFNFVKGELQNYLRLKSVTQTMNNAATLLAGQGPTPPALSQTM